MIISPPPQGWQRARERRNMGCVNPLKHENELFKLGLAAAVKYAEDRGAAVFEPTDSQSEKLAYVYRLLVHDRKIAPLPEEQVSEKMLRHRLARWYAAQLPKGHALLD